MCKKITSARFWVYNVGGFWKWPHKLCFQMYLKIFCHKLAIIHLLGSTKFGKDPPRFRRCSQVLPHDCLESMICVTSPMYMVKIWLSQKSSLYALRATVLIWLSKSFVIALYTCLCFGPQNLKKIRQLFKNFTFLAACIDGGRLRQKRKSPNPL